MTEPQELCQFHRWGPAAGEQIPPLLLVLRLQHHLVKVPKVGRGHVIVPVVRNTEKIH